MSDAQPVTFNDEDVPLEGIDETTEALVELYGGEVTERLSGGRSFVLPLRRGVAGAGGVACSVTWPAGAGRGEVTLICERDVDAPKAQRVLMLIAGVVGSLLFTIWPFVPKSYAKPMGTLAWIGAAIAIAVYFLTLRKSSGGIAFDFFSRLVRSQRESLATTSEAEE